MRLSLEKKKLHKTLDDSTFPRLRQKDAALNFDVNVSIPGCDDFKPTSPAQLHEHPENLI